MAAKRRSSRRVQKLKKTAPSRTRLTEHDRQVRAAAAQRELDRRQSQFQKIRGKVKPRKKDPLLVFVLANDQRRRVGKRTIVTARAGDRVTRGDRRKVFIFRKTRATKAHPKGRLVPYRDYKEKARLHKIGLAVKSVPPKSVTIGSADVTAFKSKAVTKYFYAGRKVAHKLVTIQARPAPARRKKAPAKRQPGRKAPAKRKPARKPLPPGIDFNAQVVPKVAGALKAAADRYASRREFQVDCAAVVRLPSGKVIAAQFNANFKQADIQTFQALGFYKPFVQQKLYAAFAEQLKGLGLVTTGSAQFISRLPVNRGQPRKRWRDSKGMAWKQGKGWKLKEAQLVRFDAIPNYIITRSSD